MLLKIYCENIVVAFLNCDFLFFILFFHSFFSFFFFFFLLHTCTPTPISIFTFVLLFVFLVLDLRNISPVLPHSLSFSLSYTRAHARTNTHTHTHKSLSLYLTQTNSFSHTHIDHQQRTKARESWPFKYQRSCMPFGPLYRHSSSSPLLRTCSLITIWVRLVFYIFFFFGGFWFD